MALHGLVWPVLPGNSRWWNACAAAAAGAGGAKVKSFDIYLKRGAKLWGLVFRQTS